MPIYTLNRRADTHRNHCEDSFFADEIDDIVIAAVFDGCSKGVNSHIASALAARAFRDAWHEFRNKKHHNSWPISKFLLANCILRFSSIAKKLNLQMLESLTTVVIAYYNTKTNELDYTIGGDGGVIYSPAELEILNVDWVHNEDSIVDFFGEHLESSADIISWITKLKSVTVQDVGDFSVTTDGIEMISTLTLDQAIANLCVDTSLRSSHAMLDRKVNILQKQGAVLGDDLTIVRYIK